LPLDARGVYLGDDRQDFAALAVVGGRPILISQRGLFPIRLGRAADGLTVRVPPPPEGVDPLPPSLSLRAPRAGDDRWTLGPWRQWRDARATRLLEAANTRRLERVSDTLISQMAEIRRHTRLARERPAQELQEIGCCIDPKVLRGWGGPLGVVLTELGGLLDSLERAVTPSERGRFAGYRRALAQASRPGARLWPARDDDFLIELAVRLFRSHDEIVIRDGALVSIISRDVSPRRDCQLGILVPEPTDNRSHPPVLSAAPAPGEIAAVSVLFVALEHGPPDGCTQAPADLPARPLSGSFPFRLFQDASGRLVGAHVIAYMASTLFVEPGLNGPTLEALLRESDAALSRQAE
jgi:hypothetical protein